MKLTWKDDRYGIVGMICFTAMMFAIALLTDGTGDEGDSIYHYLFAKYAAIHPEHFFNHWAKPFYTLVAFPFAHFGFMGVKLMNTAFSCIAVWFTFLIARELSYKWAPAVFVVAAFFKVFMIVSFSGLTEPLHDMMIAIAIYFLFTQRYAWAAVILSFLPFVRSEGLFICGVFGLYLIWMRQWRVLPLLALGHLVYSLAGYPHYHDFLWVFNKIPYARFDKHYGHGRWTSFINAMPYITSAVNCALLVIGILGTLSTAIYLTIQKRWKEIRIEPIFLLILFLVFLLMHTTFWALGIFGSFGMIRVFVAIGSVMIIIMVSGIDFIDNLLSKFLPRHSLIFGVILIATYLIFVLGHTPFGYFRDRDFALQPDQICDVEVAALVKQTYPDRTGYHYFFDAKYIGEVLNVDVFDPAVYSDIAIPDSGSFPHKSIVIWDDWYSAFEQGAPIESLRHNKSLKEVRTFQKPNSRGVMRTTVLFVRE